MTIPSVTVEEQNQLFGSMEREIAIEVRGAENFEITQSIFRLSTLLNRGLYSVLRTRRFWSFRSSERFGNTLGSLIATTGVEEGSRTSVQDSMNQILIAKKGDDSYVMIRG